MLNVTNVTQRISNDVLRLSGTNVRLLDTPLGNRVPTTCAVTMARTVLSPSPATAAWVKQVYVAKVKGFLASPRTKDCAL